MSEVVDVLVLDGGPLGLPLGCEGDTGRPLVHGHPAIAGLGLTGAQPEHVTCYTSSSQGVLQSVTRPQWPITGQGSGLFAQGSEKYRNYLIITWACWWCWPGSWVSRWRLACDHWGRHYDGGRRSWGEGAERCQAGHQQSRPGVERSLLGPGPMRGQY